MASIVKEKNGRKKIQFTDSGGQRQSIRLGIATMKQAEGVKTKVETILGDLICGRPHDDEISRWLGSLDVTLRKKMEKVGLVKGVGRSNSTLGEFLTAYFKVVEVKKSTLTAYGHTRRCLVDYFGAGKSLKSFSSSDGDLWRQSLMDSGLSTATISKRVVVARMIFKRAMKWKLIQENPFSDVKAGSQKNRTRMYFVTPEEAERVLGACPDAQWRLLFALSRFGGLRCPSEHLGLRWRDVDWKQGTLLVRSPKTEHNEGGDCRLVPLFPEVRKHLLDVRRQADDGAEFVITRYREANSNLRTQLQRIVRKAGLSPWPKLFQNLRSTRQTELSESFPAHVVCAWLGNSEKVAQGHYLQVTDAHFARAIKTEAEALPEPCEEAAQNAAQQPVVSPRSEPQITPQEITDSRLSGEKRSFATWYDAILKAVVALVGLEPTRFKGDGF